MKGGGKAVDVLREQANSVKAVRAPTVTARTDAPPPPPEALARKDAPVQEPAKQGAPVRAGVAGGMAMADSPAARRADAMRGQAMALNNVVVTGVAEAARPTAAPTAQLRGMAAPSLGAAPVCYADGRNTFVFDSTRSEAAAPVSAADAAGAPSVRRVLHDTSGAVGSWERVGADSVALFVGGRVWRGAVAPAGVVVEGRIWTRTECRRVGG